MLQNQGILINGQRVVLQEILSLHTTADKVLLVSTCLCVFAPLLHASCVLV